MRRGLTPPERIMLGGAALFFVGAIVLAAVFSLYVTAVWCATLAFLYVMNVQASRLAYRAGWLRGRWSMMAAMAEAQQRGLTMVEWLTAEAERDGLHVDVEPTDDGS